MAYSYNPGEVAQESDIGLGLRLAAPACRVVAPNVEESIAQMEPDPRSVMCEVSHLETVAMAAGALLTGLAASYICQKTGVFVNSK